MARFSQMIAVLAMVFLFIILTSVQQGAARPRPGPAANSLGLDRLSGCHIDSKLQEICQRCAKATKSNVVYPMCCSNEDEALIWCQKYMNYGIH